ncbi:hypothetical protein pVco14_008 [Vibrio phage pVco-14]|nr:hypothetical protein pVco14_008 [Vibrio phage pVco-14]
MKVCKLPKYNGITYGDIINYTIKLQDIILECKARDETRIEWYDRE